MNNIQHSRSPVINSLSIRRLKSKPPLITGHLYKPFNVI